MILAKPHTAFIAAALEKVSPPDRWVSSPAREGRQGNDQDRHLRRRTTDEELDLFRVQDIAGHEQVHRLAQPGRPSSSLGVSPGGAMAGFEPGRLPAESGGAMAGFDISAVCLGSRATVSRLIPRALAI